MSIIKSAIAILIVASICIAQSINISGIVKDSTGTGISGAIVALEKGGQTATSGPDGRFNLTGNFTNIKKQNSQAQAQRVHAFVYGKALAFNTPDKLTFEKPAFDLHGRSISKLQKEACAGVFIKADDFISLPTNRLSKNPRIQSAINDVLSVTKSGFLNYRAKAVNSDTSGIEIKMIASADTVRDADGNLYQAVKIGNQVWTVENLRTTKYRDGIDIPFISESGSWQNPKAPKFCFYANTTNADSIKKFGALYNWYVVNPLNPKKIAPAGWHVPSDSEWTVLEKYLVLHGYNWDQTTDTSRMSNNKIAQSLAAMTDWNMCSNPGAPGNDLTKNNSTGFSALPAGYRSGAGNFELAGSTCHFTSSTEADLTDAWYRYLDACYDNLGRHVDKTMGFSVRLVKD